MSEFSIFMKQNKKEKPIVKYAPSADFVDEKGNKLEWQFRAMSSKDVDKLREDCTTIVGKGKTRHTEFDTSTFNAYMVVNSTIVPDLFDEDLMESYGVHDAKDLLYNMIDNAGEYTDLVSFVTSLNGFDTDFDDKVEEAKN